MRMTQMKKEKFEVIYKSKQVIIKKITSPLNFKSRVWNQDCDEWVTILKGGAIMKVGQKKINLKIGSTLFLPRKKEHQILSTSKKEPTVWLAVYSK